MVTCVCSISLIIALLTASLLPTDIMLVSFMKNSNGTYKVRFNRIIIIVNTFLLSRNGQEIKHREIFYSEMSTLDIMVNENYFSVEIMFCLVLYGLIIAMAFIVNPFLFFYYEEKEDEDRKTAKVWEK